ncbi:hypothetical protein VCRA2112O349_140080 [Vibrio crassostreae]|nr:hypothetical protein VCRA2113O351_140042 [Vibrio crassostreae]CAK1767945.1 hypothetical protein VCRA2114O369_140079 [Vibrio crassostreae]CAK1769509.1 hypothetical protein VCRA2113O199_140079 [Vibrio crassostreae]CAK1778741.1 hypothetical protein VCRA2114O367_150041 [Vibrio crassostreae]CAK1778956.1 hypothetical protein VCRA2113O357_150042 [Vibrio crassostreae]
MVFGTRKTVHLAKSYGTGTSLGADGQFNVIDHLHTETNLFASATLLIALALPYL